MSEHFVVSSIRSREVARLEGSCVRLCEDALEALDFGNSLLGVHSFPISDISVAIIKRNGTCMSCLLPRHRSLLGKAPSRDKVNRKASQPMAAFVNACQ
jgi:hypothetical protein